MTKNILNFSAIGIIFFLISCSSPENAPFADSSGDEDITVEITSRSLEDDNTKEDMYLKVAQKWVIDSGVVSLELNKDNSFKWIIDGDKTINGTWHFSDDLKSITLLSNQEDTEVSADYNANYTIVELSVKKLILHNQDNNKILSFS